MRSTVVHRVARDRRGAVYVELLVAFLPVFVTFLCLLQLGLVFSSKLLVDHAAVQGARTAAVVFGDEPGPYGESAGDTNALTKNRRQAVRNAVLLSVAPLILDGSVTRVDVRFPANDDAMRKDRPEDTRIHPMQPTGTGMMKVIVEVDLVCKIAFANTLVCGRSPDGRLRVRTTSAESEFPYQGASYAYE
jgi:hypothetical protein